MPEFLDPLKSSGGRPYSALVKTGNLVFVSGVTGTDRSTGQLAEGIRGQTQQALRNILDLLQTQGLSANNIVKTTVFLTDVGDFAEMNKAYREMFEQSVPARTTVGVVALPMANALIEIEAVAALS